MTDNCWPQNQIQVKSELKETGHGEIFMYQYALQAYMRSRKNVKLTERAQ
jgi:hypothetical protein